MNRSLARDIAEICAAVVRRDMHAASICSAVPRHQFSFLEHARDSLHEACARFEDGDAAEEFEEFYLPLFDSLSHVTKAMYLRQNIAAVATLVLFTLDQIGVSPAHA